MDQILIVTEDETWVSDTYIMCLFSVCLHCRNLLPVLLTAGLISGFMWHRRHLKLNNVKEMSIISRTGATTHTAVVV
jgi:hypothetical protein